MKHLFYYTLKLDNQAPVHFATMTLLERSLDISFHRSPLGPVRLVPTDGPFTYVVMQGQTAERFYPTGDPTYSTTQYSGGTQLGTVTSHSIMVNDEVTHV